MRNKGILLAILCSTALILHILFSSPCATIPHQGNSGEAAPNSPFPHSTGSSIRFAVIGDYGCAGTPAKDVAHLVKSWKPDFIITTGDNNYEDGKASTIDLNIGQYYHEFIGNYQGSFGTGAHINRFFPSLGNHDWRAAGAKPYLDYFTLPGNERYYEFVEGPVHFFAIDSDSNEPDGTSADSIQAQWLKRQLDASESCWKVVYFHHAPYSSGTKHGASRWMQWPYAQWGVDVVMSGHEHNYERLLINGVTYVVNGSGGKSLYRLGPAAKGSQARFDGDYGAMLVQVDEGNMTMEFFTRKGEAVDHHTLKKNCP